MATHRFIGDQHPTTPVASVRARRAMLGSGEIPEVLCAMAWTRVLYSEKDSHERPQVLIDPVASPRAALVEH